MIKYLLAICFLFVSIAACSPAAEEAASPIGGSNEEHEEHDDEHDDEHEHEEDGTRREHGAHEHGAAELTIAWSGNALVVDLHSPAYNVVGFEHAPATEAEQERMDSSLEILQEGNLLVLNPEAECTVVEAAVSSELEEEEHADGEEEVDEEVHSEISVSYLFECQRPEAVESLDAAELFAQFPNFEKIQTQWISDTNQSAKELTADDAVVVFE